MVIHRPRLTRVQIASLAIGAAVTLLAAAGAVSCASSQDGRPAARVTANQGTHMFAGSTDIGRYIVVGWGYRFAPNEITTPKPEDVHARCYGSGEQLVVKVEVPYGWKFEIDQPTQTLTIENPMQGLYRVDLDASRKPGAPAGIDWTQPDQVTINATPPVPMDWYSPYGRNQTVFVGMHIDCR